MFKSRCKNSNLPAVAIPSDVLNQYYYYVPKNHYCKFSDEFAKAIVAFRDKHAWEVIPAIKYDLTASPSLTYWRNFGDRVLYATFQLDGDLVIQHSSSLNPFTFGHSLESFSVNSSTILNDFISTFKLNYDLKKPNEIGLGIAVATDIWNTSFSMAGDTFIANANPSPIIVKHKGWLIEGQLGFKVTARWEDLKNQPTAADTVLKWSGYAIGGLLIVALFMPSAWVAGTAATAKGIRLAIVGGRSAL